MSSRGPSARGGKGAADALPPTEEDVWALPEDELGITLDQALRRAAAKRRARAEPDHRPNKRPKLDTSAVSPQIPPPDQADYVAPSSAELTEQQQAIVSMFSDDEGSPGPSGNTIDASGRAASLTDGVLLDDDSGGSQQSNGATQFMDEESAANYQQILARRKQSNRPRVESQTSADGLPDDPLSRVAARPEEDNAAQQLDRSRVRRAQRVSESESNDEELSILDRRAVLPHRLRTRPAVSAVRRRFEEARRNVHRPVCNSGSDSDTMPTVEDALCLGGAGDTRRPALPQLDMPETDSETEKNKPCPVLVIRDSSDDDDDFISDPDDLPNRPRPTNRAAMDKFLSSFEPMREARARRRSGQRTGAALLREPAGADIRRNPQSAHPSQALDDDLADFIIDDDDDGGGGDGSKGAGHAELDGESNSSAAGVDDSHLPGTVFTLDRPQGAMALMPEEFSQLDLPTSFKIYTQYLVYWIANDRTKPELSYENARYFYLAYITVARVVDSIEQSLVASSAWLDDFRVNLNRYPEYAAEGIASVPGCEACHFRQNRTATFRVTLSGTPYSRLELAPPRPAESPAAGDADSDTASVTDGDEVDDMLASFNVGRTCKQRSELCHELHHYFYHLAYYVDVALLPVRSERGSQDPSDLDPDDLVTMLEDQGVIDRLFREFKSLLSRAKAGFVT